MVTPRHRQVSTGSGSTWLTRGLKRIATGSRLGNRSVTYHAQKADPYESYTCGAFPIEAQLETNIFNLPETQESGEQSKYLKIEIIIISMCGTKMLTSGYR
ncbi:hypothetical protein GCM10027098_03140 [Bowmanella dokdonensis]